MDKNTKDILYHLIFIGSIILSTFGAYTAGFTACSLETSICYYVLCVCSLTVLGLYCITIIKGIYEVSIKIWLIIMGFLMFPSIMLSTFAPDEAILYQGVLPILYAVSFNNKIKIGRRIFTINILLLTIIDWIRFSMLENNSIHILIMCFVFIFSSILNGYIIFLYIKKMLDYKSFIEKQSQLDHLTQIYNRLGLEKELAKKLDQKCFIAILDIDFFKSINDTYGHAEGDIVLKKLASLLKNYSDSNKNLITARYGGEEFLIVGTSIDSIEMYRICESIRLSVKNFIHKPFKGGYGGDPITVSIGISDMGVFCDELIANADSRLYCAKQSGRDRVCQHIISAFKPTSN